MKKLFYFMVILMLFTIFSASAQSTYILHVKGISCNSLGPSDVYLYYTGDFSGRGTGNFDIGPSNLEHGSA